MCKTTLILFLVLTFTVPLSVNAGDFSCVGFMEQECLSQLQEELSPDQVNAILLAVEEETEYSFSTLQSKDHEGTLWIEEGTAGGYVVSIENGGNVIQIVLDSI